MPEKQPAAAPSAHDAAKASWAELKASALLVLADGTVFEGLGFGATGHAVGEVCFNTAMTGYEEILTDPSYAGQIITFTFPHIGNVGTNEDDIETVNMAATPGARGVVLHTAITQPSNYRATRHLEQWLKARGIIGLAGIDTRALTSRIRVKGMPNAVIAHEPSGKFDLDALKREAREWPGLVGMDLVPIVTSGQRFTWDETPWEWERGYGRQERPQFHVVAIDYGIKRNILRQLAGKGCKVTVVPAQTPAEDIVALKPDGVFLSNGPGDPAATGEYAVPVIRDIIAKGIPTFGICLGHQMLGIAVGAKTMKMHQGHHGANHPVKDLGTGKVEITSMNHGFAVDRATLPANATETHVSLFDGSNCGIALKDKPVFSVHYHPLGTVHGGYAATLLDSCMGCAVHTTLPKGTGYTTLEFKVSLLRPITADTGLVRAEGQIISGGRRVATAEGRLTDARGRLL